MIIGSVLGIDTVTTGHANRLEQIAEAAIDEFRTNPVVGEQICRNRVIMREVRAAVAETMRDGGVPEGEWPR